MDLSVLIHPGSSRRRLVSTGDESFEIWLHSHPHAGAANDELLDLLARHLKVSRSRLSIIRGHRSRCKIVRCHP